MNAYQPYHNKKHFIECITDVYADECMEDAAKTIRDMITADEFAGAEHEGRELDVLEFSDLIIELAFEYALEGKETHSQIKQLIESAAEKVAEPKAEEAAEERKEDHQMRSVEWRG